MLEMKLCFLTTPNLVGSLNYPNDSGSRLNSNEVLTKISRSMYTGSKPSFLTRAASQGP